MSIIKIQIADKNFNLSCPDEHQEHIKNLAARLDQQIKLMAKNNRSASFETLLLMISLELLDYKYPRNNDNSKPELEQSISSEIDLIYNMLKDIANKVDKC